MTVLTQKRAESAGVKCIHGTPGARHERGFLVNPNCQHCREQGLNDRPGS
jgi:hypothetical protein